MPEENEVNNSSRRRNSLIKTCSIISFFCILGFGASILIATNFFKTSGTGTIFGSSTLYLIFLAVFGCIGGISFGLALLGVIIKTFSENRILNFKNFGSAIFSIVKSIFILALFPLYLIYKILGISKLFNRTKEVGNVKPFLKSLFSFIAVSVILLPLWSLVYLVVGVIVAKNLGYTTEDINIVGTGSMYPTWPKGTAGKAPKELAKEIISKAGFLPYPNGLVINGKRYFGHNLSRGDIITWTNDATKTLTGQNGSEPAGLLKRLIGLPGDKIELRDGIVYLNGEPQKEPYIAKPRSTYGESFLKECQVVTVPEGEIFAMGDNRKGSADSREIGFAPIKDIDLVLPLSKQKGVLDKNWHDASNDLTDMAKPAIDVKKFVELLNQKRKENGASLVKYEPKLDVSAKLRGEDLLKQNKIQENASYDTITNAMAKASYWNSYVWEWSFEGYYSADELIEDYIERDYTDAKNIWFDKKFDDIGIAEVQGTINGCPTQIIVIHAAGYIPPNYKQSDIDGWQKAVDNLNSVIPSWETLLGNSEISQNDLKNLLDLMYKERTIATNILNKEKANQWLTKAEQDSINTYSSLTDQSVALANKLNGK